MPAGFRADTNSGRHLQDAEVATFVDHAAAGYMGEVKNQGKCGSCWAFTANTTLEGTISKKKSMAKGEFVPPIHISEQMLIDCTLNEQTAYDFGTNYR